MFSHEPKTRFLAIRLHLNRPSLITLLIRNDQVRSEGVTRREADDVPVPS